MAYYRDLREHINVLEAAGQLIRVTREINKDTQLMPLVRWQFRGLPAEDRKAFLFENVVDVKGRRYDIPVLVGSHAASRQIHAMGMMCAPEEIEHKWIQAVSHPVKPRIVTNGPVHEEVHVGDNLLEHGGLEEFPVPISTPGFDNAPYLSAPCFVTKDPETGVRNIGIYRAMIKSRTRTGIFARSTQHLRMHWEKCRRQGKPLQAAIILGPTPNIVYVSAFKIPYGVDEYDVAGGIAGEPVELVRCKTVDIEVPARAEIVIEGELPVDSLEREGLFGEAAGYMGKQSISPYFNVTGITHRKSPIFDAFISQMPPNEASIERLGWLETTHRDFLRHTLDIPGVKDVAFLGEIGGRQFCVVSLKKVDTPQVWRALHGVVARGAHYAKIVVAVDDDIDPHDADSVIWALVYRMQPDTDVQILPRVRAADLDPSAVPPEVIGDFPLTATLMIDATRKWPYPPLSLPRKEFMEEAKKIWEEVGLPRLKPRVPWFGYSLGYWSEEDAEEAELAIDGEHYQTGEKLAKQRVSSEGQPV